MTIDELLKLYEREVITRDELRDAVRIAQGPASTQESPSAETAPGGDAESHESVASPDRTDSRPGEKARENTAEMGDEKNPASAEEDTGR